MAATLFAVVLALLIGHTLPALTGLRQFSWLGAWAGWLRERLTTGPLRAGGWALLPLLAPPLLLVLAVQVGLGDAWPLGLFGFVFAVAMLFYCWGPRDLDVDVDAIVDASDGAARREAAGALWPHRAEPDLSGPALVEAVFRGALRRWFGVLFWFLLLGPVGALLYRLCVVSAEDAAGEALDAETRAAAADLLRVLDWPTAQLMTLALALAADFDSVYGAWRDWHDERGWRLETGFLAAAARTSVACELARENDAPEFSDDGGTAMPHLRDAMSLVWRVLLLWLALLALFVLAGWVH